MPPRKTLKAFLATARSAVAAPPSKRTTPLTFVVGNESADLDSLCSALLLAYLRTHSPPYKLHVPLCHIPRADLELRPEFTAVLRDAAAAPEDVITLDDVPLFPDADSVQGQDQALRAEDTAWLLVDHNKLTGRLGAVYGERVVGCVDHHADEDAVPRDARPRVITTSGSCASLVVGEGRDAWAALRRSDGDGDGDDAGVDARLAPLALGPILMDTTNLGDKNKTTGHDEAAVTFLEEMVGDKRYERKAFFDRLTALKSDLSGMSIEGVLRKDYKEWRENGVRLGTSSVPQGFAYLVQKADGEAKLREEVRQWSARKGIDLVAVLTAFTETGNFKRELLVLATSKAAVEAAKAFVKTNKEELQLEPWGDRNLDAEGEGKSEGWERCWAQGALRFSRKAIAPMLREAMKGQR
ncbi:hypothetical protein F5Y15DRAFT_265581 [Xylariaceae sp. FL0016]|nr:hypothetical protein F5Y15DRAFT_265581 [Xylariaceae sp. FL0016]